jgi:lipid-A-disaccharide synthase
VEVLRHLPAIRRAMGRLEETLRTAPPDLLVPIDFPDFNLRLAARAKRAGVPVVYYVSPQVWAWRRGRVRTIRDLVRRMLVLFPFESSFYEHEGVPATFTGHPAAAARVPERREVLLPRLGLDPRRPVAALLPGSRRGEVSRVFPVLLRAASQVAGTHPAVQFVVPQARTLPDGFLQAIAAPYGLDALTVVHDAYPGILEVSDAAAVASGTATLDAALAGVPFVAVYRMQALSYAIAKLLVRVDHIALPNLVAAARVVPELVQGECTPEAVAAHLRGFLDDPAKAEVLRRVWREFGRSSPATGPTGGPRRRFLPNPRPLCSNRRLHDPIDDGIRPGKRRGRRSQGHRRASKRQQPLRGLEAEASRRVGALRARVAPPGSGDGETGACRSGPPGRAHGRRRGTPRVEPRGGGRRAGGAQGPARRLRRPG